MQPGGERARADRRHAFHRRARIRCRDRAAADSGRARAPARRRSPAPRARRRGRWRSAHGWRAAARSRVHPHRHRRMRRARSRIRRRRRVVRCAIVGSMRSPSERRTARGEFRRRAGDSDGCACGALEPPAQQAHLQPVVDDDADDQRRPGGDEAQLERGHARSPFRDGAGLPGTRHAKNEAAIASIIANARCIGCGYPSTATVLSAPRRGAAASVRRRRRPSRRARALRRCRRQRRATRRAPAS